MRHRRPPAVDRDRASPPEEGSLTAVKNRFVGSFPRADHTLDPPLPEIALVGRSNVGKSSLLNALVGARIARISGTPGKTRLMNVYAIRMGSGEQAAGPPDPNHAPAADRRVLLPTPRSLYLLDLPGYGYARAGKSDRAGFRSLLAGVLRRPRLAGVVWLLDARHEPSREDGAMREWLAASGVPVLAALTKADKLPQGQRLRRAAALQTATGLDAGQVLLTSARSGAGVTELRAIIGTLVQEGSHAASA